MNKFIDYGIDAPNIILYFFIIGLLESALGFYILLYTSFYTHSIIATFLLLGGLYCVCAALAMFASSKIGKIKQAQKLIYSLNLQGHETILDVGCGKGLLLIAAAKQLNHNGKAIGIDIWSQQDLSDNSMQATLQNAHIEKVSDRITVQDGNVLNIPFPDNYFDAVISSMMLHNIYNEHDRNIALSEMIRVLKPHGKLLIQDFQNTHEYFKNLHEHSVHSIQKSNISWYIFPPVRIVSAIKKEHDTHDN